MNQTSVTLDNDPIKGLCWKVTCNGQPYGWYEDKALAKDIAWRLSKELAN